MSAFTAPHTADGPRGMSTGGLASSGRPRGGGRRKRPRVAEEHRKRVRIACQTCRKNKLRCNGESPCERCSGSGRSCNYMVDAPPTATVPEPEQEHPSPTSCIPVTDVSFNQSDERLQLLQQILSKTHPELPADIPGLRRYSAALSGDSPTTQQASYSPISPLGRSEIEDRRIEWHDGVEATSHHADAGDRSIIFDHATGRKDSVTVVNQGKTHFEGNSSLWSFFRSVRRAFTDGPHEDDDNGEADCGGTSMHQISNIISLGTDWKTSVMSALPPRAVVDFLTTTFFRQAQGNYFCIHPEIFTRKLTAFYDGTHEFETGDSTSSRRSVEFISLLFMVLAIGSQFAELDPASEARVSQGYDAISVDDLFSRHKLAQIKIPSPAKNPGWRFYQVSRQLLPDIICSSTMASVQVCALQGIFLPSTTSRDAGYNMLGLALRMAINMGLHRSFSTNSLHAHVHELRNRLWWTVYVAERLYSIEMGRPLSISDSEIDTQLPIKMPEWNEHQDKATNIDGLVQMARLCGLLGKIVEAVYARTPSRDGAIIRPKMLQQLRRELQQWKADIPLHMRLEGSAITRYVAHISLTWEQASILLTRSCLNCVATMPQANGPLEADAARFLRQQAQECVHSAISCIQIMFALRSRALLSPFSFHDSVYCSSAVFVLLLASRKSAELGVSTHEAIHQGILVLLELARGSEAAASSLRYIVDAMTSFPAQPRKGSDDVPSTVSQTDEEDIRQRGRAAWRAWVTQQSGHGRTTEQDFIRRPLGLPASHSGTTSATREFADILPAWIENESDTSLDASAITPFWVPDHPWLDILSRNLGEAPELEALGFGV